MDVCPPTPESAHLQRNSRCAAGAIIGHSRLLDYFVGASDEDIRNGDASHAQRLHGDAENLGRSFGGL